RQSVSDHCASPSADTVMKAASPTPSCDRRTTPHAARASLPTASSRISNSCIPNDLSAVEVEVDARCLHREQVQLDARVGPHREGDDLLLGEQLCCVVRD